MQQHLIRSSLIVVFAVFAVFLLLPSPASAGSCVSEGNESWDGGFNCDGVPDQTPTESDAVTVLSGHTITHGTGNVAEGDTIAVQSGATLVVSNSGIIDAYGNVTVNGTLGDDNSPYTIILFRGSTFTNNGLVSLRYVSFLGTGSQIISGTGSWTGTGQLYIGSSSETTLANDMTMAVGEFAVDVDGVFSLDNHTLTFDSPATLTFYNLGSFDMGSQTMIFHASGGATFHNDGVTNGSGIFQTGGTVTLYAGSSGTFAPTLDVASGTTTVSGAIINPITVQADAALEVAAGDALSAYDDVTVYGSLSGGDSNSSLSFYGTTFTNVGSSVSLGNVHFLGGGPQTIHGIGAWFGAGAFEIGTDSETTLASNVTMAFSQFNVGGTFSLADHTLTFNSPNALTFSNSGSFDMGNQTLAFHAPGAAVFTNNGATTGSGVFQTSGTVSLQAGVTGAFGPSLDVASGATTVSGAIHGTIAVQAGATLKVAANNSLSAYGNVTIHGSLSGDDAGSRIYFYGTTFVNTGSSVSLSNVYFYATGPQTISGAGSWTGTGALFIGSGSETTLASNATMAFSQFNVSGTFLLADHILTLSPPNTLTFLNSNSGSFDMGSQTLAFHAPGGAAFYNDGATTGTGPIQTSGTVRLVANSSFAPSLEVASGTTTVSGFIQGAITVQATATLEVQASHGLGAYDDVTVVGTLSGGNSISYLNFYGTTFDNSGLVSLGNVHFNGTGSQTISGTGSWTGASEFSIDSETTLASNVTMAFSQFNVGGTLLLVDHTLTFSSPNALAFSNSGSFDMGSQTLAFHASGGAVFTNNGSTTGSGVFQTSGMVTFQGGVSGTFAPSLDVVSGATTASGAIHGAITVQAGATLEVPANKSLSANGNVTIDGTLTGGNSYSRIYFYGSAFTNSGSSVSVENVSFSGTGLQTISGAGSWTGTGAMYVGSYSETTLTSNVTMAFSTYEVAGGVFSLDDHTLAFNSPTTLNFINYGTFDIGSQSLAVHAPNGATFNDYNGFGTFAGSGQFETSGTVSLGIVGTFHPSLKVISGATTANGAFLGAINVQVGATLEVPANSTLNAYNDVTVHGTLNGDPNSYFYFYGTTFTNSGLVSLGNVGFNGTGQQTIYGAGSWTGTGTLYVFSETTLANDVTMAFSQYDVTGIFSLGDHTLTFNSPTTLTFHNWGIFDIGSQTLAFQAPNGATFDNPGYNDGVTTGSGTFQTSGMVTLIADNAIAFNPPLNVASGLTAASGAIQDDITVQAEAALVVRASKGLLAYGDVTVHGTLSGANSTSYLYFYGTTFTNNGSSVSLDNVSFRGNGPQTINGVGSWTGAGEFSIRPGSEATLANDVTMVFSQFNVSGVFSLDNHTLTFGTLGSTNLNNFGTVIGSGTVQTIGTVRLSSYGAFNPSLEVTAGTTSASGSVHGAITVQTGATLMVPAGNSLSVYNDVTVHGTLTDGNSDSHLRFYGTGPQTISGDGLWTGTGYLDIGSGSATTLANNLTMAYSQYYLVGIFSLGDHTLILNSPNALTFINNGTLDIGNQTLAFHAPNGANFYNHGTTRGSGIFQTSGTVSLNAGYSYTFDPRLDVISGVTMAHGQVQGAIVVQAGATLMVPAAYALHGYNDVTVNGTLSGGDSISSLYFYGTTFTNNSSSVTIANVYFYTGQQILQGTGGFFNNTATIRYGATVNLGSNHQMSTVVIEGGGVLRLADHTLSLSGPGTPLTNHGIVDTSAGTLVYNGTVPQAVATTNVDYYSLGIDNAAGVTLGGSEIVPASLILTNGRLTLGAHTLTLGAAATIGGTPSAAAMVVADGDGFLRKTSAGPLSFTFPVGDSSGAYTPVSLDCTTFPAGGAVDARLRKAAHPAMTGDTYLTRYWTLSSDATNAGCTGTFTYVQDDVIGTETDLRPAKYDGVAWSGLGSGAVSAAAKTLTGTFESFSDFTGGESIALAVNLNSFSAEPLQDSILIRWETTNELDNLGFNLWRNTSSDGPAEQINTTLIPSQAPGSSQGFTYTWEDTEVVSGQTYWYWLEDVDLNGVTTLHGPVSATFDTPTAVTLSELNAGKQPASIWPTWLDTLVKAVQEFLAAGFSG